MDHEPCGDHEEKESQQLTMRLLKTRSILISQQIDDKLARTAIQQALVLEQEDAAKPVTVYINSPGGSADSGFAIYDVLRFVRPPVYTLCCGLCASAAVMTYLAGERGHRYALPNARFLIHQPSTTVLGDASDIEITANEIIRLKNRYNQILAEETGKTVEQVEKDGDRDFWMGASEALKYKLVHKIVRSHDEVG